MQIREPQPTRKVWRYQKPDHLSLDPVGIIGMIVTIVLALTGHVAAAVIVLAVTTTLHFNMSWTL